MLSFEIVVGKQRIPVDVDDEFFRMQPDDMTRPAAAVAYDMTRRLADGVLGRLNGEMLRWPLEARARFNASIIEQLDQQLGPALAREVEQRQTEKQRPNA